MKKVLVAVLLANFTVVALNANAAFQDLNVSYFPVTETGSWDWTTQAAWIKNWDPWAHTPLGSLPSYNASGTSHSVTLYHNKLATAPLVLPSGTSASINGFRLGGGAGEEPGIGTTSPIKFEIDGGSLTVNDVSYIGFYHKNLDDGAHIATRSGEITIKNGGTLTTKGAFNLGFGFADSVLTVENGTFDARAKLAVGGGWQARGILTNGVDGVLSAPAIQLSADADTTGIVVNAGMMTAGTVLLGNGTRTVSRFDNFGTLNVTNYLRLGMHQDAKESVFVLHSGASLAKNNNEHYYVGYNGPGRFVIDGGTYKDETTSSRFYVGYKNHAGRGAMDIINGATFVNQNRVAVGYADYGEGTLTISNNSSFLVNNAVHVGNAQGVWAQSNGRGTVLVDDNSVMRFGQLRIGDSSGAYGEMTVSGGSVVRQAYSGSSILVGASTVGGGTGVLSVVGADSVISNFDKICVNTVADRNSGTLLLKGGRVVCRGNNAESFQIGYYANSTTTAENRSAGTVRGYGTIQREDPANDVSKLAYMTHYGKVIADGEGVERDLDMHTMCSLSKASTNATESVNFTGDDGWHAVNKGRLRLPHGERVSDWHQRQIGDFSWMSDANPRLVNAVRIAFAGTSLNPGSCYLHVDLYAPDRSDIPAGLTSRFGKDEITAVYRMGCFSGIDDTSDGHVLDWPTITFHYAKPGYDGYETRPVRLYWYNAATSTWQLENAATFDADSPWIKTTNNHPGAAGVKWNLGWYAVVVPKKRGMVLLVR